VSTFFFVLLSVLIITGALVTIIAQNAVHAALGLVATLVALAMTYVTLDAHFLGAVQVIVYAGAIMVLFLFVIMLLDATRPVTATNRIGYVNELAALGGAALAGALGLIVLSWRAPRPLAEAAAQLRGGEPGAIGETLLTRFVLPFEAVSVLLLVAVVGSIVLVKRPVSQPATAAELQPVETSEKVGA
jgi:NADH-quinone oxidoreductase subunit J